MLISLPASPTEIQWLVSTRINADSRLPSQYNFLKQLDFAVEREYPGKTIGHYRVGTVRMQVIQIGTGTHDLTELRESAPARGSSGVIGGQVSRDDVRGQPRYHRAKISAAPQVGGLIDNLG